MISAENFNIDVFHQCLCIDNRAFKSPGIERRWHLVQSLQHTNINGYVMEFGVYTGKSIKIIAEYFDSQDVWGFDSFEGLPEDWVKRKDQPNTKYHKGYFAVESLPSVPQNVKLVKGFFDQTLPGWAQDNPGPVSFLHIDCDLCSSTTTVLETLNDRIVPGTVIVFDEMYSWLDPREYDLWEQGEYLALKNWLEQHDRSFRPLLRNRYQQCSIEILR